MGFKLPGKSMTSGTSGHSSALKMKEQENAASALKYAKVKEPTSPPPEEKKKPYVKPGGKATGSMKDYAIGSKERYAEYEARGWAHDETTKGGEPTPKTTSKTTKRGGKKVKLVTDTEDYTKKTKLKGKGEGGKGATVSGVEGVRKAKTKITYKDKDRDVKLKTKYSPTGEVTKEKKTVKAGDVVTKTITKGDKTRVKTRKKGGTGLGSWAKKQLAKRAAKRAAKKLTE